MSKETELEKANIPFTPVSFVLDVSFIFGCVYARVPMGGQTLPKPPLPLFGPLSARFLLFFKPTLVWIGLFKMFDWMNYFTYSAGTCYCFQATGDFRMIAVHI
ncbi:hypothetical protein D3P08_22410 [Paenibacillus nanensis]|uniref:Uncharacterized protein n=1 Tax=Paenibacillus nanensis TaxID=393251 RepID=A0A3A1UUT3_9BACL|nr:hypothetical protein [Paenibacillus nanensis]RIX50023.1 hypothetical protein D3P08_22410 [Paenibacillus nanensis]